MDKAVTVCSEKVLCLGCPHPPWPILGRCCPTLCSSSLETCLALQLSLLQLRRQWFHLSLTMPRMSWSFVEMKARRGFAGTLWLKSYALITVLGEKAHGFCVGVHR